MSDAFLLPGDESNRPDLSSFLNLLDYAKTLSNVEDAANIVPHVFPALYALALSDLEREAIFKATSKANGATLGALRADWKAYLSTRPEEQNRNQSRNQADRLVQLLLERLTPFHDSDGNTFADLERNGHRETYRLRGKDFKELMAREFYEAEQQAPSSQAINDALGVLEGKAKFDGPEVKVFVRIAPLLVGNDLKMYLDLGGSDWQAVEVDSSGWRLVTNPPVRFRRPKNLQPLALPVTGGAVSDLLKALNIAPDTFNLLASWLIGTLNPRGPYALLELIGGQGTSKSTTAKFIKRLIDPSSADLRTAPRSEEDLMIAAQGQHILCYDNLSDLPAWFSDALCRLATGGGLSKRELFSDDGEITLEALRPVILTGISELATRPDLLDRTIRIELPLIPPDKRRPLEEVDATFTAAAPRVLGALLEAVSLALRDRLQVAREIGELPRMADFAVWVTAAEPALGIRQKTFLNEYKENRAQGDNAALEAHPVPPLLVELMAERTEWRGLPSELLAILEGNLPVSSNANPKRPKNWPQTPRELGSILRRYGPVLQSVAQLEVRFEPRTSKGMPLHIFHLPNPDKGGERHTLYTPPTSMRATQQKPGVGADVCLDVHTPDIHPTYTPTYTEENTVPVGENEPLLNGDVCNVGIQPTLSEWAEMQTEWGD